MVEMVMLADVAALNEVVVDSKIDKDPRVDEETLEDKTVVVEVLLLLEEVEARVRSQPHEPGDLFPRSSRTSMHPSCFPFRDFGDVPYILWPRFFLHHETKTLYSTYYFRLPFIPQHAFSSHLVLLFYMQFPFWSKRKVQRHDYNG